MSRSERTLDDIFDDLAQVFVDFKAEITGEVREALAPFITDWEDAGVPSELPDELLMSEVDFSNSKLTVGDWRRLIKAAHNLEEG